ncbi:hypothetical protein CEXT_369091 [Caerostris extrusa]|uniref:Uncharacterized protein n=1 Tax=Caerostris extrusa TaxID=172846 RepID=A0AAV4YC54_CAEEX|nr:hypothetical protein CEXT_369091 [Caerostris extrusa]
MCFFSLCWPGSYRDHRCVNAANNGQRWWACAAGDGGGGCSKEIEISALCDGHSLGHVLTHRLRWVLPTDIRPSMLLCYPTCHIVENPDFDVNARYSATISIMFKTFYNQMAITQPPAENEPAS